jgi:hypothetical protein
VGGEAQPRDPRPLRAGEHPDRAVDHHVGPAERPQGRAGPAQRDDAAVAVAAGHEAADLAPAQMADEPPERAVGAGPGAPAPARAGRGRVAVAGGARLSFRRGCGRGLSRLRGVVAAAAGQKRGHEDQRRDDSSPTAGAAGLAETCRWKWRNALVLRPLRRGGSMPSARAGASGGAARSRG